MAELFTNMNSTVIRPRGPRSSFHPRDDRAVLVACKPSRGREHRRGGRGRHRRGGHGRGDRRSFPSAPAEGVDLRGRAYEKGGPTGPPQQARRWWLRGGLRISGRGWASVSPR